MSSELHVQKEQGTNDATSSDGVFAVGHVIYVIILIWNGVLITNQSWNGLSDPCSLSHKVAGLELLCQQPSCPPRTMLGCLERGFLVSNDRQRIFLLQNPNLRKYEAFISLLVPGLLECLRGFSESGPPATRTVPVAHSLLTLVT